MVYNIFVEMMQSMTMSNYSYPVLSSVGGSGPGISCSVSPPRSAGRLTPAQEQRKSATFTKFARMLHVLCLVLVLVLLPERKSVTNQSVDRGLIIIIIM